MTKKELQTLMLAISKVRTLYSELDRYYQDFHQLSIKSYAEDAKEVYNLLMKIK